MRSAAGMLDALGYRTNYVMNPIEVTDSRGKVRKVDALISGYQVWAQADGKMYTGAQNALHEYFHARMADDAAVLGELRERFTQAHGEAELQDIITQYAQIYGFCYGEITEDMTQDEIDALADKYLEEYFADATANKNRARLGRKGAGRDAAMVWEVLQQREGMGRAGDGVQGVRYMYAGQKARTADQNMLAKAEEMEKQGADSETIRQETKWFRGTDGEWRFEFSDKDAEYHRHGDAAALQRHPGFARHQTLMEKLLYGTLTEEEETELRRLDEIYGNELGRLSEIVDNGGATLNMVLDHPALYESYPELRHMPVRFEEMLGGDKGGYNPETKSIELDASMRNNEIDVMRAILHEFQHAVQDIEGFATGASPAYWAGEKAARVEDAKFREGVLDEELTRQQDFLSMLEKNGWDKEADLYKTGVKRLGELQRRRGEAAEELGKYENASAYDLYHRTAGEIEARDTAERRRLTDEQRKNTRPDIDREDVVFAGNALTSLEVYSDQGDKTTEEERKEDRRDLLAKLRENIDGLKEERVIAYANPDGFKKGTKKYTEQAAEYYETFGSRVTRPGFGIIHMNENGAKSDLGHGLGRAKAALTAAVPQVLRNGKQIDYQKNWKGRGYDTYVFAGKVLLGDKPTYMAAVVRSMPDNQFYLHEALAEDGSLIKELSSSDDIKTRVTVNDGLTRASELPDSSIAEEDNNSKTLNTGTQETKYSVAEDEEGDGLPRRDAPRNDESAEGGQPQANVEDMTPTELRRALKQDRAELEMLERYAKKGYLPQEMKDDLTELRRRVNAEQVRLKEIDARAREERKAAELRATKRQMPKQARGCSPGQFFVSAWFPFWLKCVKI